MSHFSVQRYLQPSFNNLEIDISPKLFNGKIYHCILNSSNSGRNDPKILIYDISYAIHLSYMIDVFYSNKKIINLKIIIIKT